MKVIIRADGGEKIGFGHIMRTLVLAEEISKKNTVTYVCSDKKNYNSGVKFLRSRNIKVKVISEDNEVKDMLNIEADVLIVDKYNISVEYLCKLKKKFKLVYIDDNNELLYYDVDVLINQNIYANHFNYNINENAKILLGKKYVMLRDEFRNNYKVCNTIKSKVDNVFVSIGGSDDNNLTEDIIKVLKDLDIKLHIIVGPAFVYNDKLKKYESPNIRLYYNATMSDVMNKCDIAISSSGSTLYELCTLGIPTLGFIVAENQRRCAEYMEKLGTIRIVTLNNLKSVMEGFDYNTRRIMKNKMKSLIDGQGVHRIIHAIID